jgi:putative membrane protein
VTQPAPRRLSPLTPVVRSFIVVVAAGTTVARDVTRGELGPTAGILLLLLVGGGIFGAVSWLRTKFWIESDELRVDTGVVVRQSRRIRIDRLQGVDIVQPFVARLFGLAELRMDVAGGSSREGSLAYLPVGEARRLKDLLLARRDAIRRTGTRAGTSPEPGQGQDHAAAEAGASGPVAPGSTDREPVATEPVQPDRVLVRLDMRMLMLSILLSSETVVLFVLGFGALVAFAASGEWRGAGVMVPALLGLGLAQFRKLSANYGFTVSQTGAGLQIRRGMFDLSSQTIALHRVQGVVVSEPLLWRLLGWARLDVSVAGYAGSSDEGPAPSTAMPVADRATVLWLARYVLRGLDLEQVELRPVPARAGWAAPVARHFLRAGTSHDLAVTCEGWLTRRTHAAVQARIQSVRLTQGPWQRRLGLADVHVDTPRGPADVRARQRDAAEARRLFDAEVAISGWARRRLAARDR